MSSILAEVQHWVVRCVTPVRQTDAQRRMPSGDLKHVQRNTDHTFVMMNRVSLVFWVDVRSSDESYGRQPSYLTHYMSDHLLRTGRMISLLSPTSLPF